MGNGKLMYNLGQNGAGVGPASLQSQGSLPMQADSKGLAQYSGAPKGSNLKKVAGLMKFEQNGAIGSQQAGASSQVGAPRRTTSRGLN